MKFFKKTDAEFKQQVSNLTHHQIKVLDKYKGSYKNLRFLWIKYNWVFKDYPANFLKYGKCPWKKAPKTRVYKDYISKVTSGKYKVISKYMGYNKPITFLWIKYNWTFQVSPRAFKRTHFKCTWSHAPKTTIFTEKLNKMYGKNTYIVLSKYKTSHEPIIVKHTTCGRTLKTTPHELLSGYGCSYCGRKKEAKTQAHSTKWFKHTVAKVTNYHYLALGKYKNNHSKVQFLHVDCGHVFGMTPDSFLSDDKRCPYCESSKGEKLTGKLFRANHIHEYKHLKQLAKVTSGYIYSYVPNWLHGLHLDFLLKLNNHYFGIEFDGVQHFEPVDFSGHNPKQAKKRFKVGHKRDLMKDHLCKINPKMTKLIRIENTKGLNRLGSMSRLIRNTFNSDKLLMKVANHRFKIAK